MGSSGVLAESTVSHETCDNCGYDGDVFGVYDPEGPYAGWECQECKTFHDTTEETFYAGPDPDDARDRDLDF